MAREFIVTIVFSDEEQKREATNAIRSLSALLEKKQSEALLVALHYLPILMEEVERLDEAMPKPEMSLSIASQLPRWRRIIETIKEIKS